MDASLLPPALWQEQLAAQEPPLQLAGRALIWHRGAEPVKAASAFASLLLYSAVAACLLIRCCPMLPLEPP